MYEENMHTLNRFNTLSNTRKHVINKRKRTKVHYQYKSYETMHWFELLMLWFPERNKDGFLAEMTLIDIIVNYASKYQISSIED